MEQLDYDHEIFSSQQAEADKNLAVRFFSQALPDEAASVVEGRPIYKDTEMIEIRVRGDRNNIVCRPVRQGDERRFRGAFENYKRGNDALVSGTPLKEWPVMGNAMIEEMKYLGFTTVEQIAEANDGVCSRVPGLTHFKNKAKIFLEYAKGAAPLEQLSERVKALESQTEVDGRAKTHLSDQLTELQAKYNALLEQVAAPVVATVAIPSKTKG